MNALEMPSASDSNYKWLSLKKPTDCSAGARISPVPCFHLVR